MCRSPAPAGSATTGQVYRGVRVTGLGGGGDRLKGGIVSSRLVVVHAVVIVVIVVAVAVAIVVIVVVIVARTATTV